MNGLTWANRADPDQTALNEHFGQGLHCVIFSQLF